MVKYKMVENDAVLFLYNSVRSGIDFPNNIQGIGPNVIRLFKQLTYDEISHICEHSCPLVDVRINESALISQINRVFEERRKNELISRAVEMKASKKLLAEYYGIGQEELKRKRASLDVDIKRGRIRKLDENISRCIWADFCLLPEDKRDIGTLECFEEMVKLAEKHHVSVMAVHDALTEVAPVLANGVCLVNNE